MVIMEDSPSYIWITLGLDIVPIDIEGHERNHFFTNV